MCVAQDRPYVTRSHAKGMLADRRPGRPTLSAQERQALLLWFQGMSKASVGRRMYDTWHQMTRFLRSGQFDPTPVITHRFPLEDAVKKHANDPTAYVALAQVYSEADRGPQAVKLLQDAQAKFPADTSIAFELGAAFDKQKKYADAEAAFRQLLARDPENAAALNYLGYMLAERGERLEESVDFVKNTL